MKRGLRNCICVFLCVLTALGAAPQRAAAAAPKVLALEQAQRIALSTDDAIKKKHSEIVVKQMKYTESVAAIKAKVKNLKSFRWTPLLSFKFPEKLDLVTEYDLQVKPQELQNGIITLRHEKADLQYEVLRTVGKLFTSVYVLQERIAFTEKILLSAESELERNRARLLTGTAVQADVDTMEKSVETTQSNLAQLKREFETAKGELSDLLKLDVTSGYVFKNPLKSVDITRDQLEGLVEYTLKNDHVYYAARMAESVALLDLNSYESLYRQQYGAKVDAVASFLSQARAGQDLDTGAFQIAYDGMLKNFDKPWSGKIKILFFSFSREWLKGERSGTRYIEDEMYALYTACLDYVSAHKDKLAAEKALRKQIAAEYESLVTAGNAVKAALSQLGDTKKGLERVSELNKRGLADYAEVKDKQTDYQEQQGDAMELLATYNELLLDFDRLTCGGVTKLLRGAGLDTDAGEGGESRADLPTYHIYTDVADLVFVFSVQIPKDYEPAIDAFEIWHQGVQIGERTPADKALRHLALDYGETGTLTVRLYNGDEYVDECEIDTTVPSDLLNIRGGVPQSVNERIVGGYAVNTERRSGVGMTEVSLSVNEGAGAFYRISLNGEGLFTGALIPVDKPFRYLTLLAGSLDAVRAELYDAEQKPLYQARFEQLDQTLRVAG